MTAGLFTPATRKTAKARVAIAGPSGAGKTWTGLEVASGLADGGRIAVVDTERGSASLYAGDFDFDVLELQPPYTTEKYIEGLLSAAAGGYAVVLLDSITHAWKGSGGVLDQVDDEKARNRGGNDFAAWKSGDKSWRAFLDSMLASPIHVVATMRSKTEWVLEEDSRGKKVPRKIGMAPEARDGIEYEFTIVFDMDHAHRAVVSKSRCRPLADAVIDKPDAGLGKQLLDWLNSGEATPDSLDAVRAVIAEAVEAGLEVNADQVLTYAARQPLNVQAAIDTLRARIDQRPQEVRDAAGAPVAGLNPEGRNASPAPGGTAAGETDGSTPPPAETDGGEFPFDAATDEQVNAILAMVDQLPEDVAKDVNGWLETKYGAEEWVQLSTVDAAKVLADLEAVIDRQGASA